MTKYNDLFNSITKMIKTMEEVYDLVQAIDEDVSTSPNYPFADDLQTAIFNARRWRDDVEVSLYAVSNGDFIPNKEYYLNELKKDLATIEELKAERAKLWEKGDRESCQKLSRAIGEINASIRAYSVYLD